MRCRCPPTGCGRSAPWTTSPSTSSSPGTYTPVAVVTLHGTPGQVLLVAAWSIAMLGVPFKIWWLDAPVWISTGIYLAMGYMSLLAAAPLAAAVPASGLAWLVAGGLAYTAGAIIFSRERPDPWPGRFGHHEIWHLLVLVGQRLPLRVHDPPRARDLASRSLNLMRSDRR